MQSSSAAVSGEDDEDDDQTFGSINWTQMLMDDIQQINPSHPDAQQRLYSVSTKLLQAYDEIRSI